MNLDGARLAVTRAGYLASTSNYHQHRLFSDFVEKHRALFLALLQPGERICGEWLVQAHGTRYTLRHSPLMVFDAFHGEERLNVADLAAKVRPFRLVTARVIHQGGAISTEAVLAQLEPSGHGAIDRPVGAAWRVERKGKVDFLAKCVRSDFEAGRYLPSRTGKGEVWNQLPYGHLDELEDVTWMRNNHAGAYAACVAWEAKEAAAKEAA